MTLHRLVFSVLLGALTTDGSFLHQAPRHDNMHANSEADKSSTLHRGLTVLHRRRQTCRLPQHLALFSRSFHRLLRPGGRVCPAPCARHCTRFRHGPMVLKLTGELLAQSHHELCTLQPVSCMLITEFHRANTVIRRIHHSTSCPLCPRTPDILAVPGHRLTLVHLCMPHSVRATTVSVCLSTASGSPHKRSFVFFWMTSRRLL